MSPPFEELFDSSTLELCRNRVTSHTHLHLSPGFGFDDVLGSNGHTPTLTEIERLHRSSVDSVTGETSGMNLFGSTIETDRGAEGGKCQKRRNQRRRESSNMMRAQGEREGEEWRSQVPSSPGVGLCWDMYVPCRLVRGVDVISL